MRETASVSFMRNYFIAYIFCYKTASFKAREQGSFFISFQLDVVTSSHLKISFTREKSSTWTQTTRYGRSNGIKATFDTTKGASTSGNVGVEDNLKQCSVKRHIGSKSSSDCVGATVDGKSVGSTRKGGVVDKLGVKVTKSIQRGRANSDLTKLLFWEREISSQRSGLDTSHNGKGGVEKEDKLDHDAFGLLLLDEL